MVDIKLCNKCINSRPIISENGYHSICCLSDNKATECLINKTYFELPPFCKCKYCKAEKYLGYEDGICENYCEDYEYFRADRSKIISGASKLDIRPADLILLLEIDDDKDF